MCVYMCVFVCMCLYVCVGICVCVFVCLWMWVCVCVFVCMCLWMLVCVCVYVYMCVCVCVCMCLCVILYKCVFLLWDNGKIKHYNVSVTRSASARRRGDDRFYFWTSNHVIAQDVDSWTYCCYVRWATLIINSMHS